MADDDLQAITRRISAMLQTVYPGIALKNSSVGVVNASATAIAALKALAGPLFTAAANVTFESTASLVFALIEFTAVVAHDLPGGFKQGRALKMPVGLILNF